MYRHMLLLRHLEGRGEYLNNQCDVEDFLKIVNFPTAYRKDVTGMVISADEDGISAVWISESSKPYEVSAIYFALPYYIPPIGKKLWIDCPNIGIDKTGNIRYENKNCPDPFRFVRISVFTGMWK